MSFEVYIQFFDNGEEATIPVARLRKAFSPYATEKEANFWQIRYDDLNSCSLHMMSADNTSQVSGFSIWRPCEDIRLWDTLITIMRQGNAVLYFPGSRHPLVADPKAILHFPPDMFDSLGEPVVVQTGADIMADIEES